MMKQIKTLLIAAVLVISANAMNAQTKTAHINVGDLLAKLPEMTAAKAQLQKLSETLDKDYTAMATEYTTKMKKYESEATTQTEAMNETRAKEMQDMGQRIQQYRDGAQKQIQDKQMEIEKPIYDKVRAAIVKVGKAKGYQYVMDAASLILADGPDLFEDVKKELKF